MPRISREKVAARESFIVEKIATGISFEEAQAALVERDGMKMNPYRLKELFEGTGKPAARVDSDAIHKSFYEAHDPESPQEATFPTNKSIFERPAPTISEGPFYTIPELIKKLENGDYDAK